MGDGESERVLKIAQAKNYIKEILKSGKKSPFLEGVLSHSNFELKYLEYFIVKLKQKVNGIEKLKQVIDQIPSDEIVDMTHHHWRSLMSEFTAYWILETQLGYEIEGFDIQSPFRTRENSDCDAFCKINGLDEYVEVKSAHDWTLFSAPRSIKELCKSIPGYNYIISINKKRLKVTPELLNHIRQELVRGNDYLNTLALHTSYSIYSTDNRFPRDVEILMSKVRDDEPPSICFAFQPRNDEDFNDWLEYRVQEANKKGATLLFVNFIFWTPIGGTPSITDFLKQHLPGLHESANYLWFSPKAKGSVKEIYVFMPSGIYEVMKVIRK